MSASALQKQARLAERDGDIEKAKNLYEEIIDTYPDSAEAKAAAIDLEEIKVKQQTPPPPQQEKREQKERKEPALMSGEVVVTDIKMPFWSMVVFMVKASLASIPAVIILTIILTLIFSVLGGIGGMGMGGGMHR